MQRDGNLVLYSAGGQALWASGTRGVAGAWAVMQLDGNFVVYSKTGRAVWASRDGAASRRPAHALRLGPGRRHPRPQGPFSGRSVEQLEQAEGLDALNLVENRRSRWVGAEAV